MGPVAAPMRRLRGAGAQRRLLASGNATGHHLVLKSVIVRSCESTSLAGREGDILGHQRWTALGALDLPKRLACVPAEAGACMSCLGDWRLHLPAASGPVVQSNAKEADGPHTGEQVKMIRPIKIREHGC